MNKSYSVEGMSCAACSSAIERIMKKQDGVNSVDVNLTTKKMVLDYDESLLSFDTIKEKIEKAGFEVFEPVVKKTVTIPIEGMT
jgi:Cu+-exporting ATPase